MFGCSVTGAQQSRLQGSDRCIRLSNYSPGTRYKAWILMVMSTPSINLYLDLWCARSNWRFNGRPNIYLFLHHFENPTIRSNHKSAWIGKFVARSPSACCICDSDFDFDPIRVESIYLEWSYTLNILLRIINLENIGSGLFLTDSIGIEMFVFCGSVLFGSKCTLSDNLWRRYQMGYANSGYFYPAIGNIKAWICTKFRVVVFDGLEVTCTIHQIPEVHM